jgi:hypothetical protein
LIQSELDTLLDHFNNHVTRKDRGKQLPSGVSPNVAMAMPSKYGGENMLQPVDMDVIDKLIEEIGEEVLQFVTPGYAERAEEVYDTLHLGKLSFDNVWLVFTAMLPYFE